MTAHKELIERLRSLVKAGASNHWLMASAADALESQALEMEGLRKDAALGVQYVIGDAPKWSLSYTDERDFCQAASQLIGATYVVAKDAAERVNKSPWGRRTFGMVTATVHDAAMAAKGTSNGTT